MAVIAAHLHASLCGLVILFQLALVAGASWGALTQGGRKRGRLDRRGHLVAAASVPVLALMAVVILGVAGLAPAPGPRWWGWGVVLLQALSTGANLVSPSEAERRLWGPVGAVMTALALVVMTA